MPYLSPPSPRRLYGVPAHPPPRRTRVPPERPEYGNSTAADTPPPHQAIHDMTDDFGKAPVKTACEIHSLPGTRGKHLLETLEQAHVFVNLLLLAEMPVTRALPVYTERTEFLPDIIPIRP